MHNVCSKTDEHAKSGEIDSTMVKYLLICCSFMEKGAVANAMDTCELLKCNKDSSALTIQNTLTKLTPNLH